MTELPQGLRKEIALAINVPLFKKLSFFHTFPESVLSVIASHMSPLQVGKTIFFQLLPVLVRPANVVYTEH